MTRKDFLTLGSLSVMYLLFPSYLFSEVTTKNFLPEDVNTLLKSASDLRKQKRFDDAKKVYQKIILQYPNEIRGYDGMRKTLLSQNNKEWEVILMFKAALVLAPDNIELQQRLNKEYLNAATGNKKLLQLIGFKGRLLVDIKNQYESPTQRSYRNANVGEQYSKICRLVEWEADIKSPHKSPKFKAYKKEQYQKYKHRFDQLTTDELNTELNALLAKPSSEDRVHHIRQLYNLSFKKMRKEKNPEALNKALNYYNTIDKKDPLFLKYIRDLARSQKKYDVLIQVETQNNTLKKTFWSALSLLDVHIRKAEHQKSMIPSETAALMKFLEENIDAPNKRFEVNTRKIKLNILGNQLDVAKDQLLNQCKAMYGTFNTHMIDRVNVLIAKYYSKKGDSEGKKRILNIVVDPGQYIDNADPLIKSIALMNRKRVSKGASNQNLQKLISQS
ncbi:tetratricopeptide repeat protein [Chryseobacterium tructae]|uniref:Tetratricopeptide repeat protein n=1 Tax=Chryseobacterium tructae TaxID=1037380 RepID=A0ABV7XUA7_9FLAO|nr:tetratricopeptide repeat protein [Chryseobacterium tructae]MDN3691040.1 tetratricopeptide repeat protein [Chryseobacterium tructae]